MKYVIDFLEGSKEQADLLGGKGANLAEMTKLKLPVPTGFTITTEACLAYLKEKEQVLKELNEEIQVHIHSMEKSTAKKLEMSLIHY